MKRILCILLALLLLALPCLAEEEAEEPSSWSQINQAVSRGEDWKKVGTDGTFHLGESHPLEGYEGLSICEWGTWPSMDGSTVCVPMAMELGRQWLDLEEEDLNGFANFSTTPYAYERLIRGKPNPLVTVKSRGIMMDDTHPIDLVLATYPNADERQEAEEAGVRLVYVPFCYDAFIFMLNYLNPVENLMVEQIQGIYSGKIDNWNDLGGYDSRITPCTRPHGSGSQTAMEEMVMQGIEICPGYDNFVSDGMAGAVMQVGNYDNGYAAIGYSYLYYVNMLVDDSWVTVPAINGVKPTPENLRSGAYPFTVNYYAVYREGDSNTEAFVNWLIGDEGQRAVKQAGYIPLRDVE